MSEKRQTPSLGAQFDAWLRQGAKDLHNAVVPAFPDSARSHDELGTPLSPTPQMVTQELGTAHGYQAILDGYASRGQREDQQRGIER